MEIATNQKKCRIIPVTHRVSLENVDKVDGQEFAEAFAEKRLKTKEYELACPANL